MTGSKFKNRFFKTSAQGLLKNGCGAEILEGFRRLEKRL
jgi:hypothetical protein